MEGSPCKCPASQNGNLSPKYTRLGCRRHPPVQQTPHLGVTGQTGRMGNRRDWLSAGAPQELLTHGS